MRLLHHWTSLRSSQLSDHPFSPGIPLHAHSPPSVPESTTGILPWIPSSTYTFCTFCKTLFSSVYNFQVFCFAFSYHYLSARGSLTSVTPRITQVPRWMQIPRPCVLWFWFSWSGLGCMGLNVDHLHPRASDQVSLLKTTLSGPHPHSSVSLKVLYLTCPRVNVGWSLSVCNMNWENELYVYILDHTMLSTES